MGPIIPVRGAMYHAFSLIDRPGSRGAERRPSERSGPLAQLGAELAATPPILTPAGAPAARRTLRTDRPHTFTSPGGTA